MVRYWTMVLVSVLLAVVEREESCCFRSWKEELKSERILVLYCSRSERREMRIDES